MRLSSSPHRRRGALLAAPVLALSVAATLPGVATAHEFDHAPPGRASATPPDPSFMQGGRDGARVQLLTTIPTGNPHSDLDFFTKGGETYASVGTLAIGGNQGGQQIIKLTEGGQVEVPVAGGGTRLAPQYVTGHPSAACPSNPSAALGLQHDVEATPKAPNVITSDSYLPADPAKAGDAQLLIDATDAGGRCHDQSTLGLTGNPRGGLEIIDITGLGTPGFGTDAANRTRELALTSHIGESHTVNVDPQRPNIAYSVTSDSVGVTRNADGTFTRNNETTQPNALDGFEVVDLTSCLTAPYGTMPSGLTLEQKREACVPQVYRYRYPNLQMSLGHTEKGTTYGCHELQMYPDDKLACASGSAAIVFDMSGAFREETVTAPDGSRYTVSRPNGTPLDCRRRNSITAGPSASGAKVIDCVNGGTDAAPKNLGVPEWLKSGAPSLTGVRHIGSIHHAGRASATGFQSTRPATEDIDFNHEVEFTRSGRYLLSTDERGGGVTGGAQCTQGTGTPGFANGGVNAQKVSALTTEPASLERTDASYARSFPAVSTATTMPKAIYRAPIRTGAEGTFCTAHVMQQVPGQNRIVMGWYSQGTQVVDYVELPGGKLQYFETAYGIPGNANQWVSHVFSSKKNDDGTFTYYGATGDTVGGRDAIDIYKMTLPAPLTACDLQAGSADRSKPSTVSDRAAARSVHVANVDCVLNYKISSGKTVDAAGAPTTYAPTERVTRGQMASFIANALIRSNDSDAVLPAAGNDQFSDIASNTHRAAINRLARAGIVKGLTGFGGRFAPEQLITRDQMASFIVEAARFANKDRSYEPSRLNAFGDVPAGNVHERNISAGAEAGLFQGTKTATSTARSGLFEPGTQVQRDQMATFLVNLFTASIR